jgi:hypothetical protein
METSDIALTACLDEEDGREENETRRATEHKFVKFEGRGQEDKAGTDVKYPYP